MDDSGSGGVPEIQSLVELSRWHRLQEHFAGVLGIPIRTISPSHQLLVEPSWPAGFKAEDLIGLLMQEDQLDELVPVGNPPPYTASLTTPLGVTYAVVPIRATAKAVIACFIIGPMVVGPREDELLFRRRVSELGLDAQRLWPVVLSLRLYTFAGIRSALNLIEEVGTSIVELAYQAKQIGSVLPSSSKVDQAVVTYHKDHILHSLLEAATLATRAEGGSVMLYDTERQTLQMRAALGLSEEIIKRSQLKRGEGLAGLAAEERRILLVDETTSDERLTARMRRPELTSSLVAPLTPDPAQEPMGVLSLRTSNPHRGFTKEHVELLRRLLDLACMALGTLPVVFDHMRRFPGA